MKRFSIFLLLACLVLSFAGCANMEQAQILATTKPVFQFASALCKGTPLKVDLLISDNVSCLHDYTLQVSQMQKLESAELVIISGAGFEDFMEDLLDLSNDTLDSSAGIVLSWDIHEHEGHTHQQDPHIWLSISNAKQMVLNVYNGLSERYPQYASSFRKNLDALTREFQELEEQAHSLVNLSCRELITFHDGFNYLADSLDLHILRAIEEESGSEASAQELIEIIEMINIHNLPAIFTESSGSTSASSIICAETGVKAFTLDMGLSERSYFEAMYHNINTLKEALE